MDDILVIEGLTKRYAGGHEALKGVDLAVRRGEIFALLGPNGAGKTTLISIVCGIVTPTAGRVVADGHDIARDYRAARRTIGLVPQELATDMFETVWATVSFSRALFGRPRNNARIEAVLRGLSLWDKRNSKIAALSGGMKRRVLIAKALAHDPAILFLDEPTAGVDVELRQEMWRMVRGLRDQGVTVILTTHYIEEAEEMADRIGVIDGGRIVLVEDKAVLMRRLGKVTLEIEFAEPLDSLPDGLDADGIALSGDRRRLTYTAPREEGAAATPRIVQRLDRAGATIKALETRASTLEDIFVDLVGQRA